VLACKGDGAVDDGASFLLGRDMDKNALQHGRSPRDL
jgi:hypothetical protein